MSLQKIGEINNISSELKNSIPKMEKGKSYVFRRLDGVYDASTKLMHYGSQKTFVVHDTIMDNNRPVEIGILRAGTRIIDGLVPVGSWYKHILNSEYHKGGVTGDKIELYPGNVLHEQLFAFLWISNLNASNANRDTSVDAFVEYVNTDLAFEADAEKVDLKFTAMVKANDASAADVREYAKSKSWTESDLGKLKVKVKMEADADPKGFLASFGKADTALKAEIQDAIDHGVLGYNSLTHRMEDLTGEKARTIAVLEKDDKLTPVELFAVWINENGKQGDTQLKAFRNKLYNVKKLKEEEEKKANAGAGSADGSNPPTE